MGMEEIENHLDNMNVQLVNIQEAIEQLNDENIGLAGFLKKIGEELENLNETLSEMNLKK